MACGAVNGRDGFTESSVTAGKLVFRRRHVCLPETERQPTKENGGGADREVSLSFSPIPRRATPGLVAMKQLDEDPEEKRREKHDVKVFDQEVAGFDQHA